MRELARRDGVDVLISNHPQWDDSLAKFDRMRRAAPGDAAPFVIGTPAVERALTVMDECARATRERFTLAAD